MRPRDDRTALRLDMLAALFLVLVSGCRYSEEYYFRPVEADSSWRARSARSARHEISVTDQKPVRVYWNCQATRERKEEAVEQKVNLEFMVVNESGTEIELFPVESVLADDENRKFDKPSVRVRRKGKDEDVESVKVGPGSRVRGEVEFHLPADVPLHGLGSLRYEWAYQVGAKRESVSSKFLRRDGYDSYHYPYYPRGLYYHWFYCR
ncbi:MAG: hypothetical protein HYU36_11800 [Planctomycetes bacterium]|nr:hypothetical protein [Planctomycetota bacterium]